MKITVTPIEKLAVRLLQTTALRVTIPQSRVLSLGPLSLATPTMAEGLVEGQLISELLGVTEGSTLTLIDNAGGRVALSGGNLVAGPTATDFETGTSHQVTIRETLAAAENSPRETVLTITVTNVFEGPTLQPLTLPSIVNIPTTLNIVGATAGSTITGTLPAGWTLNSAARTITIAAEAEGSFQNWSLTESIAEGPNSPRTSTGTIQIVPPTNLLLLAQSQAALAMYDYTNLGHGLGNSGWQGLPAVEGGAVGAWLNCKSFPDQSFQEWFDAQPGMEFTPVAAFSGAGNIQDYGEILGPRSWRGFRDSNGSFNVNTVPTQAGKVYALSFDLSAYDATPPSSLNGVRLDTGSGEGSLSSRTFFSPGHIKAFYWSLGNPILFGIGGLNHGYRVDNVKIVEVGSFNIGHHVASQRPIYNKGLLLDGVDDYVRIPLLPNGTNYPSDVTIVYLAETVDETFMLTGTNNSSVFATAADTNTSSPHTGFAPAAYAVDGEALASPTRTTLGAAITKGLPAVVRVEGINLSRSDITELRTSWVSGGYFLNGRVMPIAILDRTAPDYARALAWAEAEAMRQAGLLT